MKLRTFLAGHTVALVTCFVTKMMCSSMILTIFDTMIVASSDKSGHNDPRTSKCWKLLRDWSKQLEQDQELKHLLP